MLSNVIRISKGCRKRYQYPFRSRYESTALEFYQNRQLELYASKEAQRLTLRQLVSTIVCMTMYLTSLLFCCKVFYGRHMNEERLIKVRLPVSRKNLAYY